MVKQVGKGVFDFSSLRGDLNSEHVMPDHTRPHGEFPNGGQYQGSGADVFVPSPIPDPIAPPKPDDGQQGDSPMAPDNSLLPSDNLPTKQPKAVVTDKADKAAKS